MSETILTVSQIAHIAHEANRVYQEIIGDTVSPPWDECDEDLQLSVMKGVEASLAGLTPEQLHASWCDMKIDQGWIYGETKDPVAKTHPCLVSYEDLPIDDRRKDYLFQGVVLSLTDGLD